MPRITHAKNASPKQILTAISKQDAKTASLQFVSDDEPGIARVPHRSGFVYRKAGGRPVRDRATLQRIKSLVIPPAWTDVWICSSPQGHIQATGRDARGRKQYRYHPRWRRVRDETKYSRMTLFGSLLPKIRAQLRRDLAQPGMPRRKVLAAILRIMETTHLRVGNEEYARTNGSYGLTTLRNRHVRVKGETIHFCFRGKSGKVRELELSDARLSAIVRRCRDLPGQQLFQYVADDGERSSISSTDVNEYLREISGEDLTAKDFRTWAGTMWAARSLHSVAPPRNRREIKTRTTEVVRIVAEQLGNTEAVCRKSYIHPFVLDALGDPALFKQFAQAPSRPAGVSGPSWERFLVRYIKTCERRKAA